LSKLLKSTIIPLNSIVLLVFTGGNKSFNTFSTLLEFFVADAFGKAEALNSKGGFGRNLVDFSLNAVYFIIAMRKRQGIS